MTEINELIDSSNTFQRKFTIAERFVVYDDRPEEKEAIEEYYRERQYALLGMRFFPELPKSRNLVMSCWQSCTLVDNEFNKRDELLKEYEIKTTVYVRELIRGEE